MKISEIITDKYKLRMPPTVYYELLADVVEVEEDQEPMSVIEDIKAEIETDLSWFCFDDWGNESSTWTEIKKIIDKHCGKGTDE